ncbi:MULTISPECIES: DUF6003 family protein [Streptomyces]|uniref:DUF6003 family protein n=1 Tax=Streptomyces TaxID=1883 RepID=UPI0003A403A4|nr:MULTISPECIES: DUF6003 family protein [Streptomyces]MBZ6109620.1 hypothetical protein [Streptomyces olivaceus]MBZ6124573.1 hypothetical protein [Streptomyces olivaceus]MBZ6144681.1 hypothetical protein [Streptomyces olivaceus]MBZ6160449.1 hypothetical protein [Streptomyces olivaceus]MBZ6186317.1 hypothetical protein [Streptomyces olivaceus]
MADDAYLFLLPDRHPRLAAPLAAVGPLECLETPAVRGWLSAHGTAAASEQVRILAAGQETMIPEDAERLPVPLTADEAVRVEQGATPASITDVEKELLGFRDVTQDWETLVHRAHAAGVPAPRIAQLTGLDPVEVGRLTAF